MTVNEFVRLVSQVCDELRRCNPDDLDVRFEKWVEVFLEDLERTHGEPVLFIHLPGDDGKQP